MFRHLFKMIWNRKKQNSLLITEMLLSFLVLFAVFTLLVYGFKNYKKPIGLVYENVWQVSYNNALKTDNLDSLRQLYETLRQTIKSLPQVKEMSFISENTPFSHNTSQSGFTYNKQHINNINRYVAEDSFKDVVQVSVQEGRWFDKRDVGVKNEPVVINKSLEEKLFGSETALGKLIGNDDDKNKMKVIGVVSDIKYDGDYANAGFAVYHLPDSNAYKWMGRILISITPDAGAAFESKLYKTFSNAMKNSNVEITHLTDMRRDINYFAVVPMIVMIIVAGFLVINVALGLFGILWYNISKRRGEIGLRRAVGASGRSVTSQLIGEALVIATFSLLVGSFFAIQFPLLNVFDLSSGTYLIALGLAIIFIYVLVLICAFYPGKQAAAIYPAVALHED